MRNAPWSGVQRAQALAPDAPRKPEQVRGLRQDAPPEQVQVQAPRWDAPPGQGQVRALRPDGHLFIGHSETLHGIVDDLETVMPTVYRKRA